MGLINKEDWLHLQQLTEKKLPKNYSLVLSNEFDLTRGRITQIRNIIRDNKDCPEKVTILNLQVWKRLRDLCLDKKEEIELVKEFSVR